MRRLGHEPWHRWRPTGRGPALIGRAADRKRSVLVLTGPTFDALMECADENDIHDERQIIIKALQDHLCDKDYLSEEDFEEHFREVSD